MSVKHQNKLYIRGRKHLQYNECNSDLWIVWLAFVIRVGCHYSLISEGKCLRLCILFFTHYYSDPNMWPWTKKNCHKGQFFFNWGCDNIWKSGIWGCKKNQYIEKLAFKVRMKFLAMHINNTKISFDIYGRKCTKYLHGSWSLLNILMIFGIKEKHFEPYNVFLAIATNIPVTGFVVQGHILHILLMIKNNDSSPISHWSGWQIALPKTRTIGWDEVVRLVWRGIMNVYTFQGN